MEGGLKEASFQAVARKVWMWIHSPMPVTKVVMTICDKEPGSAAEGPVLAGGIGYIRGEYRPLAALQVTSPSREGNSKAEIERDRERPRRVEL
jgi:hypothetical protein